MQSYDCVYVCEHEQIHWLATLPPEVFAPQQNAAQPRPFVDGDDRWWEHDECWCSCWGEKVCRVCEPYRKHLAAKDSG